ncbi:MAG: S8 family serine peptidase [Bacteroidota bacterium]|nr:S8 family serine peptidase [Bacteroidota bacterium]
MRRLSFPILVVLLLFAACSEQPPAPQDADTPALRADELSSMTDIDLRDRYIVVFNHDVENVNALVDQMTRGSNARVHFRYHRAIKGFCATLPPQALEGLRHNPRIDYIEADGPVSIFVAQSPVPSWGLDRIDTRNLNLDNTYNYVDDGSGVTAYILDTGIMYTHSEFGTRASFAFDAFNGNGADCNGHGTHVAGTIGGGTTGVAKNVTLKSVRVLDCNGSGTISGVIAGVDWVAQNAVAPAVANMSLGGSASSALDAAVAGATTQGITFVVSAGNNNRDACQFSPAREPTAITVGATGSDDKRASYSNYGSCVDIFAPGTSITSAYYTSASAYATMSGTSMAAPHVAGVAALYLQNNTSASPSQVSAAVVSNASQGVMIGNIGRNSPNLLLYSLFGTVTPVPPAAPSNLVAATLSSSAIRLTWDDVSAETAYNIEYAVNSNSNFTLLTSVGADVVTHDVTGLAASTTYYFRITASNSAGTSGYSNTASATTSSAASGTSAYISAAGSSALSLGSTWTGTLLVTVMDGMATAGAGVTVNFSWTDGSASGTGTGTTDSQGNASFTTPPLHKKVPFVDVTVTGMSGTANGYNANDNQVSLPVRINKP